jgi:hypothetical protein
MKKYEGLWVVIIKGKGQEELITSYVTDLDMAKCVLNAVIEHEDCEYCTIQRDDLYSKAHPSPRFIFP